MISDSVVAVTDSHRILGTAFFVADRLLLTCLHVVHDANKLFVRLSTQPGEITRSDFPAEVIAALPKLDVAVLRLGGSGEYIQPQILPLVPFPDVRGHRFETYGFAVGTGCELTEASGRLRTLRDIRPSVDFVNRTPDMKVSVVPAFQLDPGNPVALPQGMSGAPVVAPCLGGVVGVFAGFYPASVAGDGAPVGSAIHYAVPVNKILRQLAPDLVAKLSPRLLPHLDRTGVSPIYNERTFVQTIPQRHWHEAMKATDPSVLTLMGPSGIGKSSHSSAWATEARSDGHIVIWADLARYQGLGKPGNTSTIELLFSVLCPSEADAPDVSRDYVLNQISQALEEYGVITGHSRRKIVVVVDGLESLAPHDRQVAKNGLFVDLADFANSGILVTVVCCERSEFAEALPIAAPQGTDVLLNNVLLGPLPIDIVKRVYDEGYRQTEYPWLPSVDVIPHELLELCRIPLFISYLVKSLAEHETGQRVYIASLLRTVVESGEKMAVSQLPAREGGVALHNSLLLAMSECLRIICREEGFASPPVVRVNIEKLVPEFETVLKKYGLGRTTISAFELVSSLSKAGLVDYQERFVRISSDVVFEFLLCEEYLRLISGPENEHDDVEVIPEETKKVIVALWSGSDEIVTPEAMNELIERLVHLPPCRATSALRFWPNVLEGRADWALLEYGIQLRLFQVLSAYSADQSESDWERDRSLYNATQRSMPEWIAETVLAWPPIEEVDGRKHFAVEMDEDLELSDFSNPDSWIKMRRVLYLLFATSQHTRTVLQNLARRLPEAQLRNPVADRLVWLAMSIVRNYPEKSLAVFVSDSVPLVQLLVRFAVDAFDRDSENSEVWPDWLSDIGVKVLPGILGGAGISDNQVPSGSVYFVSMALRVMRANVKDVVSQVLRSDDSKQRVSCLQILDLVVEMRLRALPTDLLQKFNEKGVKVQVYDPWAPILRSELVLHERRSGLVKGERQAIQKVCSQLWDGVQALEELVADPMERPFNIETTVMVEMTERDVLEIVQGLAAQFRENNDPIRRALDAIVLCLTIVGERPGDWHIVWGEVSDLVLGLDAIKDLSGILKVVTREEEQRPGERYEAINLLLVPLADVERYGQEVCKSATYVDHWAKKRPRYPGEAHVSSQYQAAQDLLRRRDYTGAMKCAKIVTESNPGFYVSARCLLIVARAHEGLDSPEEALKAIEELEELVTNSLDEYVEVLVDFDAIGPIGRRLQESQRNQLLATLWAARDLRSQIFSRRGDAESLLSALGNVIVNRLEAQEHGAWGDAFRALAHECDLHHALKNGKAAIVAATQYEEAFPSAPQCLLGKMQRAVSTYYYGAQEQEDDDVERALEMLEAMSPHMEELRAVLPDSELEGIELWLGSIRSWCLQYLKRYEDAIDVAESVVALAHNLEDDLEQSKALGVVARCQEEAGRLADAYHTTRRRYSICERTEQRATEEAAAAAHMAARLVSRMLTLGQASETKELLEYWRELAIGLYEQLGRNDQVDNVKKDTATG